MGLWGIKYSDVEKNWWVDVVIQETMPVIRLEKVGEQVIADGFEEGMGLVLARRVKIPSSALDDWAADTAVMLTRVELAPESSTSSS